MSKAIQLSWQSRLGMIVEAAIMQSMRPQWYARKKVSGWTMRHMKADLEVFNRGPTE